MRARKAIAKTMPTVSVLFYPLNPRVKTVW